MKETKREEIESFDAFYFGNKEHERKLVDLVRAAKDYIREKSPNLHITDDPKTSKPAFQDGLAYRLEKKWDSASFSKLMRYSNDGEGFHKKRKQCLEKFRTVFDLTFYTEPPYVDGYDLKPESDLHELAENLALNLVDVSAQLKDTLPYSYILKSKRLIKQRKGKGRMPRERYIATVGAGASSAATSEKDGIPGSKKAMESIRKAFDNAGWGKLVDENLEDLSGQLGTSSDHDFERNMKAMIKVSPKLVIKELEKQCGYRQVPSLFYEVMAHLLKHRFLDGIINFNYDEVLDNAIEEELPDQDDYRFIYTAGHCPDSLKEISVGHRIKHPIYIKCHGTISHPNSLRFREDDAFTIEKAIQDHLQELFMSSLPSTEESDKIEMPLNLLVFGFSMENQIFNKIIEQVQERKSKDIKIWLFDKNEKLKDRLEQRFGSIRNLSNRFISVKQITLVENSLEKTIVRLWTIIKGCFKETYEPKGIARHEFVNFLFREVSPIKLHGASGKDARHFYHNRRIYLEIAIHLLQSNGKIHLSQISGNRIGRSYNAMEKDRRRSLQDYLKKMGLVVYKGFMNDTFMIEDPNKRNIQSELIEFVRTQLIEALYDISSVSLRVPEEGSNEIDHFKLFAEAIMRRRMDMVSPKYINVHNNLFSTLEDKHVMNTSLAWIYNYRKAIGKTGEWDLMLTITEQGRFLTADIGKEIFNGKFFEPILSTFNLEGSENEEIDKLYGLNLLSDRLHFRPWWRHNQHMVILMKRNKASETGNWRKDWKFFQGFYYTHRMLSRRITPVWITEKVDGYKLLSVYSVYWQGAKTYTNSTEANKHDKEKDLNISIVSSREKVEEVLQHLFDLCDEKIRALKE